METRPKKTRASNSTKKLGVDGEDITLKLITVDEEKNDAVRIVSNIWRLLGGTTDPDEAVSLYFSFICLQLKYLKDEIVESLKLFGISVVETPWATSNWADDLKNKETRRLTTPMVLVAIGQLLFIPFKNLTAVNYEKFMSKRTVALCSLVGDINPKEFGIPVKKEVIVKLRSFLNGLRDFKLVIIHLLMDSKYTSMAVMRTMIGYVGEILSWTDMLIFTKIRDELVRTDSPLLGVKTLLPEWEKFDLALATVAKYKYPQYFAITADVRDAKVIHPNNFPHLAAVALLSAEMSTETVRQMVGLRNLTDTTIEHYLRIHRRNENASTGKIPAALIGLLPRFVSRSTMDEIQDAKSLMNCDEALMNCDESIRSLIIKNRNERQRSTPHSKDKDYSTLDEMEDALALMKCDKSVRSSIMKNRNERQRSTPHPKDKDYLRIGGNETAPKGKTLAALDRARPRFISRSTLDEIEDAQALMNCDESIRSFIMKNRNKRQRSTPSTEEEGVDES